MKGARYWEADERKLCRVCGGRVESWEHVLEECRDRGVGGWWWKRMEEILGQEGEGEWWMRGLEKERGVSVEEEEGRQYVGEGRERCESDEVECGVNRMCDGTGSRRA
ncbi:cytochrome p450 4c1 [Lasius niger]|uniref:Cytochrome p450 4c1 n=1 Tax=Lasius niger TaxID=67767 RepID=A0A0J7K6W5_LASNI|nr:cytochrome p450 4c1 [Lasius niger]